MNAKQITARPNPTIPRAEDTCKLVDITFKNSLSELDLKQISRRGLTNKLLEGGSEVTSGESFKVAAQPKINVLVVIDNLGSMEDEQLKLEDKLPTLMKFFE